MTHDRCPVRDRRLDPRRILAMGGGGFTMDEQSSGIDRLVLELTGKPMPRICFLPTASGDPREQVIRFHERFGAWACVPTTLSLFHLGRDRVDPAKHLLAQDAIYVGGGSMRNMLAIWREHGIDVFMRHAWEAGVVLAGLSAGAMCWFQGGISLSGGRPEVVRGIGLLRESLSVHLGSEPQRLPVYRRAVQERRLPVGYAVDDGAALLYVGTRLSRCVISSPGARVLRSFAHGGAIEFEEMPVQSLHETEPALAASDRERAAIAELRQMRAARRGLLQS